MYSVLVVEDHDDSRVWWERHLGERYLVLSRLRRPESCWASSSLHSPFWTSIYQTVPVSIF